MKTDYNKPAQELTEEFIRKFKERTSVVLDPEEDEEQVEKFETYWAVQQATLHVEGLLEVCPKIDIINYGMDEEPNPVYQKLTECLTILKSKG